MSVAIQFPQMGPSILIGQGQQFNGVGDPVNNQRSEYDCEEDAMGNVIAGHNPHG